MFGRIVLGVDGEHFDHALDAAKKAPAARRQDTDLDVGRPQARSPTRTRRSSRTTTGRDFPDDPYEQLDLAIKAVFASWFGKRANDYRKSQKIAHDLGTAVNVLTMVFGNMGDDSGTGVAFTRDPTTGEKELYGEYLINAQGEDVVAGIRTPAEDQPARAGDARGLRAVPADRRAARAATTATCRTSSSRSSAARSTCSRPASAKRTAAAAVKIAVDMVERGRSSPRRRRSPGSSRPRSTSSCATSSTRRPGPRPSKRIAKGLNASPGAAVGKAVFDADDAVAWVDQGREGHPRPRSRPRPTTSTAWPSPRASSPPAAARPRTPRSSRARSASRASPAAPSSSWTTRRRPPAAPNRTSPFKEGDWISVDGSTGDVFVGALPTVSARFEDQPDLQTILGWADEIRRLGVWTNADKPEEAAQARSYGAQGIGLCRTEHMFREGARLEIVRDAILVANAGHPGQGPARGGRDARRGRARAAVEAVRRGAGQARDAPAGRLRGHLQRDGRPAGRHPPDRPAAPRVPAEPRGAARQGRPRRGRQGDDAEEDSELLATIQLDARAEPDARPARLPPRPDDPGLREDPDAGDPQRRRSRSRRPAATRSPRS